MWITKILASPIAQRVLLKVPLLSRLISKKAISTIIWNAVVSRLKSTIGVTFFASLIAIKVGVTEVVHFIHALYLAVQVLFIKAAILLGTESTLVEVFLAGVIIATWYHSAYFIEASSFILNVYQEGLISG